MEIRFLRVNSLKNNTQPCYNQEDSSDKLDILEILTKRDVVNLI